jgi:hypothetical protein
MALPKTFTAGERLFAEDLNEALEYLDGETVNLAAEVVVAKNTADAAIPLPDSPANGDVLVYNSSTSSWEPGKDKVLTVESATTSSVVGQGAGTLNIAVTFANTYASAPQPLLVRYSGATVGHEFTSRTTTGMNVRIFYDNPITATSAGVEWAVIGAKA